MSIITFRILNVAYIVNFGYSKWKFYVLYSVHGGTLTIGQIPDYLVYYLSLILDFSLRVSYKVPERNS